MQLIYFKINSDSIEYSVCDLNKIIKACRQGERDAQEKLYRLYGSKLFAVCIKYSNNRTEAEDFFHEGFIKIFENIKQYRFEGSFEGWMRRIMVNTVLEAYRKNKNIFFLDESNIPLESVDESTGENEEGLKISVENILEIAKELPERYKLVFNLFILEEFTHEEIAQKLGISIGTSKSNLSRARQWLRKRLSNEETDKVKSTWQH